jgi:hypothetical protein
MEETKMKCAINATALIILVIISAPSAHAATSFSWSVEPGPHGGYRVSTSAGNYIVVINGNSVWVGTEGEFDHERVKTISAREGFSEFKIAGTPRNEMSFVSSGLPSVSVGNYRLAAIDTGIIFGAKPNAAAHHPKKPSDTEYVSIDWVQNKVIETSAIVYDVERKVSYRANYCGTSGDTNHCEFVIPASSLTHPSSVFFASPAASPGVLPMKSIAYESYKSLVDNNKTIGSAHTSDEDLDVLRRLHALDSSIPTSIR